MAAMVKAPPSLDSDRASSFNEADLCRSIRDYLRIDETIVSIVGTIESDRSKQAREFVDEIRPTVKRIRNEQVEQMLEHKKKYDRVGQAVTALGQEIIVEVCWGSGSTAMTGGTVSHLMFQNLKDIMARSDLPSSATITCPFKGEFQNVAFPGTMVPMSGEIVIHISEPPLGKDGKPFLHHPPKKREIPCCDNSIINKAWARGEKLATCRDQNGELIECRDGDDPTKGTISQFVPMAFSTQLFAERGAQIIADQLANAFDKFAKTHWVGGSGVPGTRLTFLGNQAENLFTVVLHAGLNRYHGEVADSAATIREEIIPKISEAKKAVEQYASGLHFDYANPDNLGNGVIRADNRYTKGDVRGGYGYGVVLQGGLYTGQRALSDPNNSTKLDPNGGTLNHPEEQALFFTPPEGMTLTLEQLLFNANVKWHRMREESGSANSLKEMFVSIESASVHTNTLPFDVARKFGDDAIIGEREPMILIGIYGGFDCYDRKGEAPSKIDYRSPDRPYEFPVLHPSKDAFRRRHQALRGIMRETPFTTDHGVQYFFHEHIVPMAAREETATQFPVGLTYAENLSWGSQDVVNRFITNPHYKQVMAMPGELVDGFDFVLDLNYVPVSRVNFHPIGYDERIYNGEMSPEDHIDYIHFWNERLEDRPRRIYRDPRTGFYQNLQWSRSQTELDPQMVMFDEVLKLVHEDNQDGLEGLYVEKKNGDITKRSVWFDVTLYPGVDDDHRGMNHRYLMTLQLAFLSHLNQVFSGRYRHLGFPKAMPKWIQKFQNWDTLDSLGLEGYAEVINLSSEIGPAYRVRVRLDIEPDEVYSQADWDGRYKDLMWKLTNNNFDDIPTEAEFQRLNTHNYMTGKKWRDGDDDDSRRFQELILADRALQHATTLAAESEEAAKRREEDKKLNAA